MEDGMLGGGGGRGPQVNYVPVVVQLGRSGVVEATVLLLLMHVLWGGGA